MSKEFLKTERCKATHSILGKNLSNGGKHKLGDMVGFEQLVASHQADIGEG